jgi:orotate phosphoribosyltransferase
LWTRKNNFPFPGKQESLIMFSMLNIDEARAALRGLLQTKSVFRGDFTLSSGVKSNYYVDCKLTTLDPEGAWLAGQLMHSLIRKEQAARKVQVNAVGGLTMGADPIALAVGMYSHWAKDAAPLQVFCVRKSPKTHGQTKLIEGGFQKGDSVVVIDDVVTRGESTIAAINAVEKEGGSVAFVAVLVDRQEGGREKIEAMGHRVVALFNQGDLLGEAPPR